MRCRPVRISPSAAVRAPQPHVWESSKSWLNNLGRQTVQHHALADASRLAILDTTSEAKYRLFLERIYGFEAAVECHVSGIRGLEVALYGARARLARLHQDLVVLGHDPSAIAALAQPTVTAQHSSDALGWLFVIERHVLLAGLIRRVVATQTPALARATGYFATHTDGGVRLREFGDLVRSSIAHGHARPELVLAAARRAFDAQHQWYTARSQRRTAPVAQRTRQLASR